MSCLPVAEAILDQSLISGVGNIAKSEALYVAGIDPHTPACWLDDAKLTALARAISQVCWESYHNGGRWKCRACRRRGKSCETCGGKIEMVRQPPSQRSTYCCPSCQKSSSDRESASQ